MTRIGGMTHQARSPSPDSLSTVLDNHIPLPYILRHHTHTAIKMHRHDGLYFRPARPEAGLSAALGVDHVVAVANGLDALRLIVRA